ncbi:MAG TPA: rhodanese-like domain-containing protein [Burkholderiaceae bacterium]|nr:rhodanese-like domain-containing protein [Burkholderiaceae bacterium]
MRTPWVVTAVLAGVVAGPVAAQAPAPKATSPKICMNCHQPMAGSIRGYFDNVAFKSTSIQLAIDDAKEIVRFDPKTLKVVDADVQKPAEALGEARKGHETRIAVVEKDGQKWATEVVLKGPVKVAKEDLVGYEFVRKQVERRDANVVLIDSRPLPRFQQGTIPGAVNIPYPAWDKVATKLLPADKSKQLVFFCQGVTCQMSPLSQRKAVGMGYRNTKVYHEGVPEWQTRDYLESRPEFVKETYVDKDIPSIIVDVRNAGEAQSGHIKGAVGMPVATVKSQLKSFPAAKLQAPVIVYDGRGGADAIAAARELIKAGQQNVQVVSGGLLGWQARGYAIESGVPAPTKVAYVPKPRPGSIAIDEFSKLARAAPADVIILDVRNKDEANAGMIKGAVLIPEEELAARIAELPKDKRIIVHCSTGIRAEMAYHKLKDAGYKAGFLNAEIDVDKQGNFKVTAKV